VSPLGRVPIRRRRTVATAATALAVGALAIAPAHALTSPGLTSSSSDAGLATANGRVSALLQIGNTLYVGGEFDTLVDQAGSHLHRGLAALDATTGQVKSGFSTDVASLNPATPGRVAALAVSTDGQLVVGGAFTSVNGQPRTNLAKVSAATGVLNPSWNPAPNSTVSALAVSASRVIVGGRFTTIAGRRILRLAEVDLTSGLLYTGFAPNPNDAVRALHLNPGGGSVIVGGDFTSLAGVSRQHLGSLSVGTGAAYPWRPDTTGCLVEAIATDARPTRVFVGCGGGIGGNRVDALYYSNGASAWPALRSSSAPARTDGDVQAVAVLGDTVYAGGHFTTVDGTGQQKLAALDAYTGGLQTWNPGANSLLGVFALTAAAGRLWAGGDFTTPREHLARFTYQPAPGPASPVPALVAAQGINGSAYVYDSTLGRWFNYGGRVAGPPAVATAQPPYKLYLVASTPSGLLYSRTTSTNWSLAAGGTSRCTNPDVTTAGGQLVLACTGTNRQVYTARFDTSRAGNPFFATFTTLGGVAYSGPAVYAFGSSSPVFTVVGSPRDSTLADLYTRTTGTNWTSRDIRCAGHPVIDTRAGQFLYTGCRDSLDNTLHVTTSTVGAGAVFDGSLGGSVVGGVDEAVAADDSAATFYVEGSSGQVYRQTVGSNGGATGFTSVGGSVVGGVRGTHG